MNIRLGKKSDKKNYLKIQKETFPKIDIKRDSKFFDEKIKEKEIFVLEDGKYYIGHICFGKHLFNPPFAGSVFIEELVVKEEFRGKGYGTALINKLIAYCKKKKIMEIVLGTGDFSGNKVIKWYKKMGFKKVGKHWGLEDENSEYDYGQIFYAIKVKDWRYLAKVFK